MSYALISEAISKIDSVRSWQTLLVSYNHTRRPNEYTCYKLNFANPETRINLIRDMSSTFMDVIEGFDRTVRNYTGYNSKNVVERLNTSHESIRECWNALIGSISICDDATPINDIRANAFIVIGTYRENGVNRNIYFLSKRNPIVNLKRRRMLIARGNNVVEVNTPIIQFGRSFDAIVYKDILYAVNNNLESIFNMEYSRKLICKSHIDTISDADIIHDIELYRTYALSGHTPYKFLTFSDAILGKISEPSGMTLLHDTFKIPINAESGKYDLMDEINAKNFTLIVCGKTKHELFEDLYCEVPTSSPMTLPR